MGTFAGFRNFAPAPSFILLRLALSFQTLWAPLLLVTVYSCCRCCFLLPFPFLSTRAVVKPFHSLLFLS